MIGALRGRLLAVSPDEILVDCQGVGYRVHVPLSTYYELQGLEPGAEIRLTIHTHVREDAIALFGFWTERERLLFERLIGVSGIGPKLARVVLSGMAPDDLVTAIARSDVARLASIPGIGKKTAERMALELRDKVSALGGDEAGATSAPADDDLVSALENLGYRRASAERAVAEARDESPGADFPTHLRLALKRLARI